MPTISSSIVRSAPQSVAEPRGRKLPADVPDIIMVGRMAAKKVAQTADMVRYVVHLKGKPTFLDIVSKYNPSTALKAPEGFLKDRRAVVLTDRDGVLNKAKAFLNKPTDVTADAMIPEGLEGAKVLNQAGVGLAIVTNQGGYQIGKMSFEELVAVNVRLAQQLSGAGGRVDSIVICPFNGALESAKPGDVDARKPASGMPRHMMAMAESVGLKVAGMVGDQRTDGAAGQGAGLPFFAVTDATNGRWNDELDSAKRKGEKLPELKADAMEQVPTFAASAGRVLARLGLTAPGSRPAARSEFATGPAVAVPSSGVAPREAVATGALQTLRSAAKTSELPSAWLRAATEALHGHAAPDPTGYYDYRVALHGKAAARLAKALGEATGEAAPRVKAGSELLLVNIHGADELSADVFALDVLSHEVCRLGQLGYDSLETALGWDGFKTPELFEKAVLLPTSNTRWASGSELAGFGAMERHKLEQPVDFDSLLKLGPSQEPALGEVGAAIARLPGALDFYKLSVAGDARSLSVKSGSSAETITATAGSTFTGAGWSTGSSIDTAVLGFAHPRLDTERWLDADRKLAESRFGVDNARPLLWLKQSDGAVRFLAFSAKPDEPVVLEVEARPLRVTAHRSAR